MISATRPGILTTRLAFLPSLLLLAGLPPAQLLASQEASPRDELPALSEVIDVRVVNLEAVVTDRHGVRVPGLEATDFRLLIDGEEVPIEYFTEVRGGDALSGDRGQGASSLRDIPAVTPGEPLGTSYLVFVDEFFTRKRDRDRVLAALERELGFLSVDDRMAIVAWDGRNLDMISNWNQSERALGRVLKQASYRPAYGLERLLDQQRFELNRGFLRTRSLGATSSLDPALDPEERAYAHLIARQLEGAVGAASATLRSFGAPEGRKVMILVSGGWPFRLAEFASGDPRRGVTTEGGLPKAEELYRPLVATANLLGFTVYPVDAPGLQESSGTDASRATTLSPLALGSVNFFQEADLHHGLQHIATETGGRALLNGLREHPFSAVVADTRSFYWLGFTPQWSGDDARHDVEIEILRPKLALRARSGFSDFSRERQITMAVESALLFGNPAGSMPLVLEVGPSRRAGLGKIEVPLILTIPTDAVALLPYGDQYVAQLELRIAALDEDGGRSDVSVVPIEVKQGQAPQAGDSVYYQTTVRLRKKPHDMVVAVYDKTSGAMLSTLTSIGP